MKIEIKNWVTDEIICSGDYNSVRDCVEKNKYKLRRAYLKGADLEGAYLKGADLEGADLEGADLEGAYLKGADLKGADLKGAYLKGADLEGAYLKGADLKGADLEGAKMKEPLFLPDIYSLKLLPPNTKLRFWKYLKNGGSPYYNHCKYEIGKTYTFDNYDSDEHSLCAPGGNVATLMWCLKDNASANEFIEVEFTVKDIVAIPYTTDGKFRVRKFTVIRKHDRKQVLELLKKSMKRRPQPKK